MTSEPHATSPLADLPAGSARELLRVALPLVISSGSASLMYVIDRVFLAWYSTEAVAAALPASLMHWTLVSLAIGTIGYVNAFVAQYEGARERSRVGAILWQGVYCALFTGILIAVFGPVASKLFGWFRHEAAIQELEAEFFNIICWGSLPLLLCTAMACYYSGRGETLVIMWVNIAMAAINIGLDYLLIFGFGSVPAYGMAGAATATVCAWSCGALMYLVALARAPGREEYALFSGWRFDRELFVRLLRFGFPNGFQLFIDIFCFTIFINLVGSLGWQKLAATNLAFNLNTMAFIPLLGVGTAVVTLTGQRIGEGRPELAVRTTWLALAISCMYMSIFVVIYWFAPRLILLPYKWGGNAADFTAIENEVVVLLRFIAVYSIFDAMTIVFSSTIRGAGDTRFALVFSFIVGLVVLVLPTYVARELGSKSLIIPWVAVTSMVIVLGFGFFLRFQQGRWKTMRIIEKVAEPETVNYESSLLADSADA